MALAKLLQEVNLSFEDNIVGDRILELTFKSVEEVLGRVNSDWSKGGTFI